jgi:hypothetical protein
VRFKTLTEESLAKSLEFEKQNEKPRRGGIRFGNGFRLLSKVETDQD